MNINKKRSAVVVAGLIGTFMLGSYLSNKAPACDDAGLIGIMKYRLVEAGLSHSIQNIYEVESSMKEGGYSIAGVPDKARVCGLLLKDGNNEEEFLYATWVYDNNKFYKGL